MITFELIQSHHPSSAPRPASGDKGAYATDFDESSEGENLPAIPQRVSHCHSSMLFI